MGVERPSTEEVRWGPNSADWVWEGLGDPSPPFWIHLAQERRAHGKGARFGRFLDGGLPSPVYFGVPVPLGCWRRVKCLN